MDREIVALDIGTLRLSNTYIEPCPKPPKKPRKPKITGNFLKGPIPLAWLTKAASLPGKAFQTGVVREGLCLIGASTAA